MATAVTSVDALSVNDRKVIIAALDLKAASCSRAARAASNEIVADAYRKEADAIQALIVRFS
nr:MAG: hypothetical protein [Microvirus sp.]